MDRKLVLCLCYMQLCVAGVTKNKEDSHSPRLKEVHLNEKHIIDDHEAFLGDSSKRFDEMTPEESKENLQKIFSKIDTDNDKMISRDEMEVWINRVTYKIQLEDAERVRKLHNLKPDELYTWEMHKDDMYGDDGEYSDEDPTTKTEMEERDKKRWAVADKDGDGKLSTDELLHFLHPESDDNPEMRALIVQEVVDDIDKDGDKLIDEEEFIRDLWTDHNPGQQEPEWVKTERQEFRHRRDKNGNGKLDADEIADWILPRDHDHVKAEVDHLFAQADEDEDSMLSLSEVLDKTSLFAGSQATNFGESFGNHDEL